MSILTFVLIPLEITKEPAELILIRGLVCKKKCFGNSRELNIFFYRNLKLFVPEWLPKFVFPAKGRQAVLLASLVDVQGRQKKQKYSSYTNILMRLSASKIVARNLWLSIIFNLYRKLHSKSVIPTRSQERPLSFLGRHNGDMEEMNDFLGSWKAET